MSDRDEVRALAEEIHEAYKSDLPRNDIALSDDLPEWLEPRLTAFLAEREGEARDREASLQMSVSTNLASQRLEGENADLQAQLHRALGEGAGLRGVVEGIAERHRENHVMQFGGCKTCELIDSALASSPLSERAGEFIQASLEFHDSTDPFDGTETRFHETADALRSELAREGGE